MKIHELIEVARVGLDLHAEGVASALELVARLAAPKVGLPATTIQDALIERERLGATAVGGGFAIPHCKIEGLRSIWVSVARFDRAVDFGGGENSAVRFVFVVLSPTDQPAVHLQVLSQIARLLKHPECRRALLDARDAKEVVATIRSYAEAEGL